jgi:hypothetical protein
VVLTCRVTPKDDEDESQTKALATVEEAVESAPEPKRAKIDE